MKPAVNTQPIQTRLRRAISALTIALIIGSASIAGADSMTLNTYYPSPYGAYDRVRLVPGPLRSGACEIGTLYYYEGSGSDDNQPFVCIDPQKDGTGEWGPLVNAEGPIWTQDGDYIYPTDDPTSPLRQLFLGPRIGVGNEILEIAKDDTGLGQDADISLKTFSATQASRLEFRRSRGTHSAPAAVNSGDMIGEIIAGASTGVSMPQIANIAFYMAAAASPGSTPGYLRFLLCPQGSTAWREIVRLTSEGDLGIGTGTPLRQLHVKGDQGRLVAESIPGSSGMLMIPASGDHYGMAVYADELRFISHPTNIVNNHDWDDVKMVLDNTGHFGVGHMHPGYDIHTYTNDGAMLIETNPASLVGPSAGFTLRSPSAPKDYVWYALDGNLRMGSRAKGAQTTLDNYNMTINYLGHLGVNQSWAAYPVDVNGDIRSRTGAFRVNGSCVFGVCCSDERLKNDITRLSGSLDRIAALQPSTFKYIDEKNGQGTQTGLIAQEVEEIFPGWIEERDDGYKAIEYGPQIQMHIIQSLKELKDERDLLITELLELNTQIKQFKRSISESTINATKAKK